MERTDGAAAGPEPDNSVKVREYSRKITDASNHLLGLINDILDISKIESGKMTLNQSVFSLNELLESINVVVRPAAGAKKQSLQIKLGEMKHELFVVADDGYGITEEFKRVIFEPFTRAESSTVNKEVGTGLGLAITKNVVDLMGGTIELESAVGKGSTFVVELPLRIPHEEQDEHFWEKRGVSRILLVDDEKRVCDGVRSDMEDAGVEVDAVYSGEEAGDMVRRAKEEGRDYSAIILDWQMPGMNGLDTAREIRKIIPIDTPVLFLTSYDWASIETEALELDVDGFLAKPFTVINLKENLLEVEHFKNAVAQADVKIDLKGMHFLVAEDNQLNAEILVEILRSEGASSDLAENGQIAVEMFETSAPGTYDGILMDVMMPILNGYDATRQIRASKHPEAQSIPVVAMTANAFVRDVQDALDAGMNAHITKPINMDTLKATLASCLRR